MSADASADRSLIAGRYAVEETLGRGATGTVYRVHDTRSARLLALKRLRSDGARASRHRAQLEREYHTLAQLAHPRIIEVYDYGVDDGGPYYTMELLDGEDLRSMGKLDWRTACALLCDVASSLAILHSRGLIHRDVSARNVRCTQEGRAKLIDFGAMMPMGPAKDVVGTPPFVAPEALQMQSLDARVDLYALGALAYFMLTGHNAYGARKLADLRDAWRTTPAPPKRFSHDIPDALSRLVMRLLTLDRSSRPDTAAEVMRRLAAIAELPIDERIEVSRSYLSTPVLIGRESSLLAMRKRILWLTRNEGGTILIEGLGGSGRSRLLDACVLEAKLLGATVLRADASDAQQGELGVLRALGNQLAEAFPERVKAVGRLKADVLGAVIDVLADQRVVTGALTLPPRMRRSLPPPARGSVAPASASVPPAGSSVAPAPLAPERSLLLREMRELLLEVAQSHRIVIAVDDVDRIDDPSAALLAALAHRMGKHSMIVAVTTERGADFVSNTSLKVLRDGATLIAAEPLDAQQNESLLRSVFGDVEHLGFVAGRIHALAQGSPRTAMELAQHLVDRSLARYQAGAWFLPDRLDESDLPNGLYASLAARLSTLSHDARVLVEALAVADGDNVPFDEYEMLADLPSHAAMFRALDELVAARILAPDAERYRFAQRGYLAVLREHTPPERRMAAHRRVAQILKRRDAPYPMRAYHLLHGGREREGIELLSELDVRAMTQVQLLEDAYAAAQRLQLPSSRRQMLHLALINAAPLQLAVETFRRHLPGAFEELERDCGLRDYRELQDQVPEAERLGAALTRAQARYDQTPEDERGLPILDALRDLSRFSANCCSIGLQTYDLDFLESLPSLAPLEPLSPALAVMARIVDASRETLRGRTVRAREIYQWCLARIAEPDRGGFDDVYHHGVGYALQYLVGLVEASMGMEQAEERAKVCESDLEHRVNAWRLRVALHLNQGDPERARRAQRRSELLLLQESQPQRYLGTSVGFELLAHAISGDLLGLTRCTSAVAELAARFDGWKPAHVLGQAHMRALQGDFRGALDALEPAYALARPGRHPYYAYVAAAQIGWLADLGQLERALEVGAEHVSTCQELQLEALDRWVYQAYAQVLARAGRHAEAIALCDSAIARCEQLGVGGLSLGNLYEARARIALQVEDYAGFGRAASRCAAEYQKGKNPALSARLARLFEDARKVEAGRSEPPPPGLEGDLTQTLTGTEHHTLQSLMLECADDLDRARCALTLLLQGSTSRAAHMYVVRREGLVFLGSLPDADEDVALSSWLDMCLEQELDSAEITETAAGGSPPVDRSAPGRYVDSEGLAYDPLFLEVRAEDGMRIVAVIAMHVPSGLRTVPSKHLLDQIAEQLLEHGDALGVRI